MIYLPVLDTDSGVQKENWLSNMPIFGSWVVYGSLWKVLTELKLFLSFE